MFGRLLNRDRRPDPNKPRVIVWGGRRTLVYFAPIVQPQVALLEAAGRKLTYTGWSHNPNPGRSEVNPDGLPELIVTAVQ